MRKCKWKNRTIMIAALFCLMAVLMPMSALADTFTDTGSHWAKDKIESWAEKGYVSGYQDGSFKPDQNITRAEFMVIVNKAFGFTKTAPIDFSDVKDGAWYYDTIAAAKAAGYISGDPAGTMRPDDPITREEAASIIMRLKNLTANEAAASQFTDAALITWSKGAVGAVADAGIMKGYPDGSFQPKKFITRAEAIVALYAAIDYENEKPDTPTKPGEPVTPEAPNVTADDFLNKVYGMTTAMEYKLDDGQWVRYDAGEFAKLDLGGKHTLLVRYAAEGINPAGPAITLKFTSPRSGGGSGKITTPEWAATGDLIRSDEDGSVYTSYILMYGAKQIPLTEENIASFRVLEPGEEEPTDLIPDADPLLWFDILNAPGDYVYTVKTKAGVTYKATLTWTVPKPVEASATGKAEVDVSEGILRAEYQLIDEETPIDLSTYTKLYRILPDAEATIEDLGEPDEESTVLWFSPFMNEGLPLGGNYLYLLLKDEIWYTTTIPFNMALGNLEPTGQIEVSEEVLNIAFELMDEEGNSIPLTDDNIDYILEVYTAGLDDFVVKNPLPDNDPLLWFNVEKPAGVYGYLFTTVDGTIYNSLLEWPGANDQVINGDFETGDFEGWLVKRSGIFPQVQGDVTSDGEYAAFMGDGGEDLYNGGGRASITQYLSIADNASTPYLELDYKVEGQDNDGEGFDWMKVFINNIEIDEWWSDTDGWQNSSYDLSAYKGKIIELKIESWASDGMYPAYYYVDNVSIEYINPPADIEITGFDAIPDVDGGTAGAATYADADAVIAYLNENITAVTITGTTDTVPVTSWTDTDSYDPNTAGSYTFTSVLGDIPAGYANTGGYTAEVEVVVAAEPPIILTADTTFNDVDHEIEITFTANADFADAITNVSFNGVDLTENTDYTVSSDKVTLKPAGGNAVLQTPATGYVVISATGYTEQSVEQTITAGAAASIAVTRDAVPGANGEVFAIQPEITIYDQYGNICADGPSSGAYVYAGSGSPNLSIYGNTGISATEGVVNYTDLECWANSPGTGTIIFELIDGPIHLYTYFNITLPIE